MHTERTDTESSASTTLAKVTFNGETKRIRLDQGDFDSLVQRTRDSFNDLPEGQLKFFYVDDENDMISVSSQADLSEAIDLNDRVCLTVASSAKKAVDQLVEPAQEEPQLEDNLIEVVSEPGLMQIDTSDKMLEQDDQAEMNALKAALAASNMAFDQNVDMDVAREIQQAAAQQADEGRNRDLQTAVIGEVQQAFAERFAHIFDPDLYDEMVEAEEEANAASEKKMVNDMVSKLKEIFLGEVPSGNESTSATDANEDEESSDEDEEELDEETKLLIQSEVRRHFQEKIDEFYIPAAQAAVELQKNVVHEGVVCDGCQAYPIVGIRYKCSVQANVDYCETCEASDIPQHVTCKIRRPEQTPVRLICQYKNQRPLDIAAIMAQTQAAAAGGQEE